nr:MAG TPA: hypothetical protein [Caudoviricetes sp.]
MNLNSVKVYYTPIKMGNSCNEYFFTPPIVEGLLMSSTEFY